MRRTASLITVTVLVAIGGVACSRAADQQAAPAAAAEAPAASAAGAGDQVEVSLKTDPEPAKMGDNLFEATVMQDGRPVDDATVSVEIFMAAMPAMKMPEMKTTAELKPAGNGVYRGNGQVMRAGTWDVTVVARRNGQEIGSKRVTVTAK
jgi:uncharacterized GH25 family protein